MTDIDKLVKRIMKEAEADGEPVTEAEAREMAEMEIKAKGVKVYATSETPKAKAKREPKVDVDKVELVKRIRNALNVYTTENGGIENLEIANAQREVTFTFGGAEYSVVLTKHRAKKEG